MKILSYIPDNRIKACNVSIELTSIEYISIAKDIIDENEYQRKKVISSIIKKTLKDDLRQRCTIPPIVLGVKENSVPPDFNFETFKDDKQVESFIEEKNLIILDGLQRTYVLLELESEEPSGEWLQQPIRCEIYIGLEKLGILYRMLTLNTGQTTMSTRHLLEILYFDYLDIEIKGIKLMLDKDEQKIKDPINEYKFKEVIEGYNSFIEGKEVPIKRADILQNIDTLNSLEKTDDEKEGFKAFLLLYNKLLKKFEEISNGFEFDEEKTKSPEFSITSSPFGKSTVKIFGKSQSLTGFGAALNFLKRNRDKSFEQISEDIERIDLDSVDSFYYLIKHFDYIRNKSKKVGNDQRFYFKIFYRTLFDPDKEISFKVNLAIQEAYKRIQERLED